MDKRKEGKRYAMNSAMKEVKGGKGDIDDFFGKVIEE